MTSLWGKREGNPKPTNRGESRHETLSINDHPRKEMKVSPLAKSTGGDALHLRLLEGSCKGNGRSEEENPYQIKS